MNVDLRIAEVAARQHSVFTLAQATGAGATPALVRHRLETGRWGRLHRNVFRLAGSVPAWDQRLFAAWLAAGPGAVVSHAAAAHLWRLPGMGPALDVTIPASRRARLAGVRVHRAAQLEPVDRIDYFGLAVTTPTRTLIDRAAELDRVTLETLLDHCLSRRMTTPAYLRRRLERLGTRGRKGAVVLTELLEARAVIRRAPESEFERRLLNVLARLPGPSPVAQHEVRLRNGDIRRLDAAWPEIKVGIEADSYVHHSSLSSWSGDHTRNLDLFAEGWHVIPVTWLDLETRPTWVLEVVEKVRCAELWKQRAV